MSPHVGGPLDLLLVGIHLYSAIVHQSLHLSKTLSLVDKSSEGLTVVSRFTSVCVCVCVCVCKFSSSHEYTRMLHKKKNLDKSPWRRECTNSGTSTYSTRPQPHPLTLSVLTHSALCLLADTLCLMPHVHPPTRPPRRILVLPSASTEHILW